EVGAREHDAKVIAPADTQPVLREGELALGSGGHLFGVCLLHPRLGGEEPALRHQRGHRLARVLGVERGGYVLGSRRLAPRAYAPPQVELPVGENTGAFEAARITAQRAAAARERGPLRIERGARHLDERGRLLDARGRDLQVWIARERLLHQRIEL